MRTHMSCWTTVEHTDTQQFISQVKQLYNVLPIYLMKLMHTIQPSFVEMEGGIITPPPGGMLFL